MSMFDFSHIIILILLLRKIDPQQVLWAQITMDHEENGCDDGAPGCKCAGTPVLGAGGPQFRGCLSWLFLLYFPFAVLLI